MSSLSRRDFLKRSGALVAMTSAGAPALAHLGPDGIDIGQMSMGRAFDLTAIHAAPHQSSAVVGQLAPDTVIELSGLSEDWYQVEGGWVRRKAVQPILPYSYPVINDTTAFWAELIAPVSTVKAWCAAHAPIVGRLGFGAVVYVMDCMIDDSKQVWYGVAAEPGSSLVGWTPALHYAEWIPTASVALTEPLIRIATQSQRLMVYDRGRKLAEAHVYSPALRPGTTLIHQVQPGAAIDAATPLGLPWLMRLDNGYSVHGTFWHNDFGEMGTGSSIQLTTFAARWLYERLQSAVKVVIE
jgi:hypothetical protein